ncbi:hypothetical protein [Propionimicrobium sp. PCR01-08-3]|uniref:hypothetical protein n=1 Tax=Propionimicrobium sp. PCR01-08-3 TaxID=3052086 RepID=UPI00255C6868|nr:hypothetical protein [Propionimicrobium sp. PCR01-08-3]WIY81705.1 hypothetical protein QQ658_09225 [Propionimicrobium sp. PCR01-08-3]
MTTVDVSSFLPYGRALTRADLEAMPDDDGRRYELIDGVLIVSPSPRHLSSTGISASAPDSSCRRAG